MTTNELNKLWVSRDARYAMRRVSGGIGLLSDDEIAGIKQWRRREIEELPVHEQDAARFILRLWSPPAARQR